MIKLIACDLDGTLLQEGMKVPDPALFPIIEKLYEKGILFIAASGRQYPNLRELFAPVADKIGYICENGAVCFYNNEVICESYLERELGKRMLKEIREKKDCEILLSGQKDCYVEPKDMNFYDHMVNVVGTKPILTEDTTLVDEPFYKIAVCNFNGIDTCIDDFRDSFSGDAKVVTSGNIWLDMLSFDTDKGKGIEAFMKILDITPAECAAFGDNENDLEMLSLVKHSYAMTNAKASVLDTCRYTCDKVEPALLKILE